MRGDKRGLHERKGCCKQMRRASTSKLVGRRISQRSYAERVHKDNLDARYYERAVQHKSNLC